MTTAASVDTAALAGTLVASIVLSLVVYAWLALALSLVFRKAGVAPWRAWVPVYNTWTLIELGGYPGWIALAALVPFGVLVVWVFVILAAHRVSRAFGYGTGMTVLAALVLPVWASILGFGPARWLGPMQGGVAAEPALRRRGDGYDATGYASGPMRPAPPLPQPSWQTGATPFPAWPVPSPSPAAPAPLGYAAPPPVPTAGTTPVPAVRTPAAQPGYEVPAAAPWVALPPAGEAPPSAWTPVPPVAPAAPAPQTSPEDWSRRTRRDPPVAPAAASAPPLAGVPTEWPSPSAPRPAPPTSPPEATPSWGPARTPAEGAPIVGPTDAWPVPQRDLHPLRYSPWQGSDELDDLPDEVSAVQTIPGIGAPRSARSSVSAQHTRPEIPEDDDTVVVVRRRAAWELVLPLGPPVPITATTLLLGRRPSADAAHADAQLVPIIDETRTVSKRHARLSLRDDSWWIVDLGSTNGVMLTTDDGAEFELEPGIEHPAGHRFLLGDAEVRIQRGDGG